ncbi:Glycine/D-amino acid oxidase, deaminating [Hyella patelloides LEGE 07179]|uniref:Glycine/D-amino acid oxidase, deaminating n=1 Tax=Hyella patelloides LEGE 07179 TaxID=945734 RepID=A0A563VTV4_9CYAN|nr:FAD-dependent oxidoreductase [Hyella patelloides]VEP14838.1 Glycine/D-amino acid oxidase, deaminating [Hyella patelloides LEGE 07179]
MSKIAIIGCGVVGATIAYELSLIPELEITVIEKNTFAHGATGAALGILMGAISGKTKGRAWKLREASLKRYPSLISELEAQTKIAIPVNRDGIVKLLFTEDKIEKWQKLQQTRAKQGWNLEIWDKSSLKQKCPEINDTNLIGAVYSPQDSQINPQILTKALVKAATLNGVEFQFGVSLNQIGEGAKHQQLDRITTTKGNLDIDYLIIAAGLGSTPLTAFLHDKLDIRPVLGQAIKFQLEQNIGLNTFQPIVTGDDVHIVPLGNQQYWLGATVEFPDDDCNVVAKAELLEEVHQQAIAFCPTIANATILDSWQGKRPRPYGQAAPVIGKLSDYDNVLLATAHYRNGILLAPGTAREIKNLLKIE